MKLAYSPLLCLSDLLFRRANQLFLLDIVELGRQVGHAEAREMFYRVLRVGHGSVVLHERNHSVTEGRQSAHTTAGEKQVGSPWSLIDLRSCNFNVKQLELFRLINMREGHSYVQLVLLSNIRKRRQR